jgi:hypothetical protein
MSTQEWIDSLSPFEVLMAWELAKALHAAGYSKRQAVIITRTLFETPPQA